MRERRNETISLLYSLSPLRSVLYTPLIRLEPNLFCVPESLQFVVAAAAADAVRPYLSFWEDYLASESRYLNSC